MGDSVTRPTGDWTPTIHALLIYLEEVGFHGAPRVVGIGRDGRERLSFIEGECGSIAYPAALQSESGVAEIGRFIREYHDAVAGFSPPPDARWRVGEKSVAAGQIVCHGDFGHWNLVWRGSRLVGAIDWDFAEPDSPLRDLATAAFGCVPFLPDEAAARFLHGRLDRSGRLAALCDGYGAVEPRDVVEQAVIQLRRGADRTIAFASEGREPWTSLAKLGQPAVHQECADWIEANCSSLC